MERGPGRSGQGWRSHLIHCELVLGLAQLPVASGELTNEVVAARRPGVGEQQLLLACSQPQNRPFILTTPCLYLDCRGIGTGAKRGQAKGKRREENVPERQLKGSVVSKVLVPIITFPGFQSHFGVPSECTTC